jgi:hypothetical protein
MYGRQVENQKTLPAKQCHADLHCDLEESLHALWGIDSPLGFQVALFCIDHSSCFAFLFKKAQTRQKLSLHLYKGSTLGQLNLIHSLHCLLMEQRRNGNEQGRPLLQPFQGVPSPWLPWQGVSAEADKKEYQW